jgi:hypothetical protein
LGCAHGDSVLRRAHLEQVLYLIIARFDRGCAVFEGVLARRALGAIL